MEYKMLKHLKIKEMKNKEDLGDELCKYCPLEKKGVYSVPGGFVAGCEGSECDNAYENYLNTKNEKK